MTARHRKGNRGGHKGIGVLGLAAGVGLLLSAHRAQAVPFTTFTAVQEDARETGAPRDFFDQLVNQIATDVSFGGTWDAINGKKNTTLVRCESGVHPLPQGLEKRQTSPINMLPVGLSNSAAAAPNSFAASSSDDDDVDSSRSSGVPGSSMGPPAFAVSGSSSSDSDSSSLQSSDALSTQSNDKSSSSVSSSPSALDSSSSAAPTSSASSSSPISSSTSASSSNAKPKPTDDKEEENGPSILSPKHKLFPLFVAGIAAGGILALLVVIAIARACAHDSMRRDAARQAKDPYSKEKGDRLTSSAPGMSAARSIRRAITKKKLGSFARRQQDGSVLIDVGDEVFSVPAHLAESYRKQMIQEMNASSLSNGSKESIPDGAFGRIRPRHLTGSDPDVEGWREKLASDEQVNGTGANKPTRTLSQRLADRLRSLIKTEEMDQKEAFSFDTSAQSKGAIRQTNLSSQVPVLIHGSNDWAIKPSTDARDPEDPRNRNLKPKVTISRKPVQYIDPKKRSSQSTLSWDGSNADANILSDRLFDLEKQAHVPHERRRKKSELSHERVTLSDDPSPSSSSSGHETSMDTYAGSADTHHKTVETGHVEIRYAQRAKSIRPLTDATYRHRKANPIIKTNFKDDYPKTHRSKTQHTRTLHTTTGLASPQLYSSRSIKAPITLRPEKPVTVKTVDRQKSFRPLPLLPQLSPFAS